MYTNVDIFSYHRMLYSWRPVEAPQGASWRSTWQEGQLQIVRWDERSTDCDIWFNKDRYAHEEFNAILDY